MNGEIEKLCPDCERAGVKIAKLNDQLRKTGQGGVIMVTRGVRAIEGFNAVALMALLAAHDKFDEDNDPYGEHDFGDIEIGDHELLWKIDYYAQDMLHGSPDPANPDVTCRVMTVMLVSEY